MYGIHPLPAGSQTLMEVEYGTTFNFFSPQNYKQHIFSGTVEKTLYNVSQHT